MSQSPSRFDVSSENAFSNVIVDIAISFFFSLNFEAVEEILRCDFQKTSKAVL